MGVYCEVTVSVNPRFQEETVVGEIQKLFNCEIKKIDWLDGFFSLDASVKISQSLPFKKGQIYGIDISSGVAVKALEITSTDHVLDLCCAPGAKLCYISDMQVKDYGTITGVDISMERLYTCRSLLRKYAVERGRLFHGDGTKFNVYAPSRIGPHSRIPITDEINQKTPVSPFHATKLLRNDPQIKHESLLYDKVLVDAECTHDGSITHIKKYNEEWDKFDEKVLDNSRISNLRELQSSLLENGFRLLKPGGILVYSTCSFSRKQNEEIILNFLKTHDHASLEPIPGNERFPVAAKLAGYPSELDYVLRFDPESSNTSGFFVARIRKAFK